MYGRNCSLRCTILLISGSKPSRFGLCGAEVRRQQPGRAGAPGLHDRASARIAERLRAKTLHVGPPGVGGFSLPLEVRWRAVTRSARIQLPALARGEGVFCHTRPVVKIPPAVSRPKFSSQVALPN